MEAKSALTDMSCQEYIGKIWIKHERSPAPAGSGYIARRPVRACCAPAPLLQRSHASASPPQGVTIPNAKTFLYVVDKKLTYI